MNKAGEHDIELVEPGEHAPEALEPAKEAFDLISLAVEDSVILPGVQAIGFGRNDGKVAHIERHLAGFLALVGAIHDQRGRRGDGAKIQQELPAAGGIVILARGECEGYCAAITRGNQMNFGGPTAAGFSDGLGTVFFNAPVPSG